MEGQRTPKQIEIVGKPVEIDERTAVCFMCGVGPERGTLGTPADGAADMAERDGAIPAGNGEIGDLRHRGKRQPALCL